MQTEKKPLFSDATYRKIAMSGLVGALCIASGFANVAVFDAAYSMKVTSLTTMGNNLLNLNKPNTQECADKIDYTALKLARFIMNNDEFKDTNSSNFKNNVNTAVNNAKAELLGVCSTDVLDRSVTHAANSLGGDVSIAQLINTQHQLKLKEQSDVAPSTYSIG